MLKRIAFAAIAPVAVVLLLTATKPDTLRVERWANIKALPEHVLADSER